MYCITTTIETREEKTGTVETIKEHSIDENKAGFVLR